jgi:hypothetical protein
MSISEKIFAKLKELEENPLVPFLYTQKIKIPESSIIYEETDFIHFDKTLYLWELNFLGNGGRYLAGKINIELSKDFLNWICKFKISDKNTLIQQLLNEKRDVLQIRCALSGQSAVKMEKLIKPDLEKCFRKLK